MKIQKGPVFIRKEENGLVRVKLWFCSQNISRTAGFTTRLREHNIEPWIVSASAEEIVRMVASDPKYGLHIKPENVIGVMLLSMKMGMLHLLQKREKPEI